MFVITGACFILFPLFFHVLSWRVDRGDRHKLSAEVLHSLLSVGDPDVSLP